MPTLADPYEAERRELLEPVLWMCWAAGIEADFGYVERESGLARGDGSAFAVVCAASDGSWDAAVTVGLGHPFPGAVGPRPTVGLRFGGLDLGVEGHRRAGPDAELVYSFRVSECDSGQGGHGPRPLVRFEVRRELQHVVDDVVEWVTRPARFHRPPPTPEPRTRERRAAKVFAQRQTAALTPAVLIDTVPDEAAADVAALDHASLLWNFPRGAYGRLSRSAVVVLAGYGGMTAGRRGPCLVVRSAGDGLVVRAEEMIGLAREHRWDQTPWLWDRRRADTPNESRWQASAARDVAPIVDLVRRGDFAEALARSGVQVDADVAKLLAGDPPRLYLAELNEKWVGNLAKGLAECAPWRFAAAIRSWNDAGNRTSTRARPGVPLFGLGGVSATRKPTIALATRDGAPILRLINTGSVVKMPRSLWEIPADLAAELRGWTPGVGPSVS